MFNHVELDLPKLSRETIDGVRYYSVPDEDELLKLVSITSVTSHSIERFLLTGEKESVMKRQIVLQSRNYSRYRLSYTYRTFSEE